MTLRQVANKLLFIKPLLNFSVLLCLCAVIYLFLFSSITLQDQYALPSLLLALWSLLFSALLGLSVNAPNEKVVSKGWFSKLRYKLAKSLFTLSIIIFILLTFAVLYITFRLLFVWL